MIKFPFTVKEFLDIFAQYNQAIEPMQIVMYILGLGSIFLVMKENKYSNKLILAVLSFMWLWMGMVYQIKFFSSINKAAFVFGIFFIIQGLVFLYWGLIKEQIKFQLTRDLAGYIGGLLIVYALVIYPIIGSLLGHSYPYSPCFGVAPCPTTIFTFGMLLWTNKKFAKSILFIPLMWSMIGFTAAIKLGIKEDIGLLAAGVVSVITIFIANKDNRSFSK